MSLQTSNKIKTWQSWTVPNQYISEYPEIEKKKQSSDNNSIQNDDNKYNKIKNQLSVLQFDFLLNFTT